MWSRGSNDRNDGSEEIVARSNLSSGEVMETGSRLFIRRPKAHEVRDTGENHPKLRVVK